MKRIVFLISCLMAMLNAAYAQDVHISVITADKQQNITPQQVLQRLEEGNQRFVNGKMKNRNTLMQAHLSAAKQHPVAVILSCIDSRTPPEIIFDQGIGDIFSVRIAGNIQNSDILGSMEFGTKLVGAKLIAVIAHTNCGAMKGACQKAVLGHLTNLLQQIQPAVVQSEKELNTNDCQQDKLIDQIAKNNVLLVMAEIQKQSPIIAKLIQEGKIGMVGGIQDLATGKVTFFDTDNIMPIKPNNS